MDFESSYIDDYTILHIETGDSELNRTAWVDKYTTTLYSKSSIEIPRFETQPLPDYLRWIHTCEFHYMTRDESALLEKGPWNCIPGLFIPNRILDLCLTVFPDPSLHLSKLISILSWTPPNEVAEYYKQCNCQVQHLL